MGGTWKKWTKKEDLYLNENFNKISIAEMQDELGCNRKTILNRLIDLDIIKTKKNGNEYTIVCKFCSKDFTVAKAKRHREYCGRSCQSKAIVKKDSRKKTACVECGKIFDHYGDRILCSVKCNAKYMSKMRLGENNPSYKLDKEIEQECLNCNEVFVYTMSGRHKSRLPKYCTKECWDEFQKGKNRTLDGPACYGTKYPVAFKKIKEKIRTRDNNQCILCSSTASGERRIPVHHVDYDKNNNEENNLVCLCERCHGLTNFNRTFWEILFKASLSGSKIVKKGWGLECHITNNKQYCLKYLIFFKDKKFSFHFHTLKKELWHCLVGKFKAKIDSGSEEREFIFSAGDKLNVNQNTIHQITALENSILVEVSTTSYPEDSYRIQKGD